MTATQRASARQRIRARFLVATATAAALTLGGACSSGGDEPADPAPAGAGPSYQEGFVGPADGGDPVDGGELTFAAYAEPASLDPAVTVAGGPAGGSLLIALYDVLVRYDAESETFVPQLAESLEPDEDFTTWTLTLRDGATFSDGSPLDSAAVKASQERYVAKPGPESALWSTAVAAIRAPDPRTVVYELAGPWSLFPSILSTGPGMIVAPSVDEGSAFTPIGAGAFVLDHWAPQEELVYRANEDYWDGPPHLDQLRAVFLNDQEASVDSLASASVDMALIRDPDKVDALLDDETGGYLNLLAGGNVALINAEEGRPGADPRVRQAMALAIDPAAINERAFQGHGLAGSTLFLDYSRWHTTTTGPDHDPDRAEALLEEAKADGYDGTVHYVDGSDPASRAVALTVKASLEAVGFTVDLDLKRSVADQITAVAVNRDYDVTGWGLNLREGDPFSPLYAALDSSSSSTFGMATSPELDGLLSELMAAPDADAQLDVMDRIQQQLDTQVPILTWGPIAELNAWRPGVHGVVGTISSMVLFSKAWVE
ncbi:ABC transporter substrate-binding protein [Nocardioides sp. YIM 152315]|uniref:ABC transporter substrate-binding protein n=1 Tax=Nocardioides sp. YIM 152315 TaxID=3031760 RepID=UPI0023DB3495|nr:ABC transporter substrate-binding protein [Nocardioides sp. YIM 152315]MDF1604682.1 ABC transporter substrate-binding protein [Nocardioides sp. YIM 152315]